MDHEIFTTLAKLIGHSLWLGLLLPLLYFFYIKYSTRCQPRHRVAWGLALLFLLPACVLTFATREVSLFQLPENLSVSIPVVICIGVTGMWIAGIAIAGTRICYSVLKLDKLRKSSSEVPFMYRSLLQGIRERLKMPDKLAVRILSHNSSPMLCGISRPTILLPESSLATSDEDNLSSIVAHETAHFLRGDLIFNFLQTIVSAMFFYHPGVRWLSREIRIEREKACDDRAVEMLQGKRFTYASALLATEQTVASGNLLSLAFGLDSTADRAARISFGEKQGAKPFTGLLAASSILIVIAISLSIISVVKIEPIEPGIQTTVSIIDDIFVPCRDIKWQPKDVVWTDKVLDNRKVPMMKSVLLIEKNGVLHDPTQAEPRLFREFPNQWLIDNHLDMLATDLPYTDPDGDLFTVLEEYEAGTDPQDSASHPDPALLLSYTGQRHELYRISYAARPDDKTIQLIRYPTVKYPKQASFFVKQGEWSPDGRIQLRKIEADKISIFDAGTTQETVIAKGEVFDFKTLYAGLIRRGSENEFFVKEGTEFTIPDYPGKWKLTRVADSECEVEKEGETKVIRGKK